MRVEATPCSTGAQTGSSRPRRVRVELDESCLLALLKARRLHAADLRCLDCESKNCLLRLCLEACADTLAQELRHETGGP